MGAANWRDIMEDQFWLSRTHCDVCEEMKQMAETLNFGGCLGLISELRAMGCRMESALGINKDIIKISETLSKKKKELKKLKKQLENVKQDLKVAKRQKRT